MSKAKKSKTTQPAAPLTETPVEELPDFSFVGTDGEYYQIGKTPHEFVALLTRQGLNQQNFTHETLTHWIWLHTKCVPNQKHLMQDDIEKLYFQCDVPHIVDCIFRRLAEAQYSTADAFKTMNNRLSEILDVPRGDEEDRNL